MLAVIHVTSFTGRAVLGALHIRLNRPKRPFNWGHAMATPIEDYRNAAFEHQAAVERAKQILEKVHKGAEMLQQWQSVIVTDIAGAGLAENIGLERKATEFDGANWPTGEQITEALNAYHATRQRLIDKYDQISNPEPFVVQNAHQSRGHDPQFDYKGLWRGAHGMRVAVRRLAQRARQLIPTRLPSVVKQALVFAGPRRIFSSGLRLLNFSKAIWRNAVARVSGIFWRVATFGVFVLKAPARIFSESQRLFRIGSGGARRSRSSQPSQIARQSVESRVQPVVQHRLAHSAQAFDFDLFDAAFGKQRENEAWAIFWMLIFAIFLALVILSGFKFG
jgi:hypothetical protein